ncbi:hypothetical protein HUU53_03470 [Candidatus Micrarchaeota archaeon]|nr:hypothetical protein [Candidatus Micrarchaeota archaeon]
MRDRNVRPTTQAQATDAKNDMQNMDAKINLLAQKIKTMEKNMQVIGTTIVALNDKIEKNSKLKTNSNNAEIDTDKFAAKEDLAELRALIEQVNPLSFATISEVKELVDEKIQKALRESKK